MRYSQEISEDYQLILLERGAHSFVGTFDGHPYVAPFSGNIIELCPVGALTSRPYRFRARPWEIEGAGTLCTLCPSQCNVTLTVRDERVLRVLARQHDEVDDGWLCDKGRFAYQAIHVDERITAPMIRDGGELRDGQLGARARRGGGRPAPRRRAAPRRSPAAARPTRRASCWAACARRARLAAPRLARPAAPSRSRSGARSPRPRSPRRVSDLEFAHAVLVLDCEPIDAAPILELRIRKGVRRNGVTLAVASDRPSALDPSAVATLRFAPGRGAELAGGARRGAARRGRGRAAAGGLAAQELAALAARCATPARRS